MGVAPEGSIGQGNGFEASPSPHRTTYSRILGETQEAEELEEAVGNFFAGVPSDGQLVQIAIDGKTLRGSIPGGQKRGVI